MFTQFGHGGWRFNLLGFPVRVDLTFWLLAIVTGLGLEDPWAIAIWVAVFFVSILAHELGHALMGRAFGFHSDIQLYSMGGLTSFYSGGLAHWQDVLVSLAGPCTGLAIGGCVHAAILQWGWPEEYYPRLILYVLRSVNAVWALLNLLPILPLDGGQITESVIHWVRGYRN